MDQANAAKCYSGRRIFSVALVQRGEQVADLVVDLSRFVDRGRDLLAESLAVTAAQAVDGDMLVGLHRSM